MAKKNAKKDAEGEKGAAVVKDEGEGNEAEEAEDEIAEGRREPMQVEIGDFVKVKQMLDESTVSAVLTLDYDENHYWDNVKLLLMVVACAFAMVAQFYPMPFPESRPLLGICCAAYFVASTVLQGIVTYIEQDTIMLTHAKNRQTAEKEGLRIRTTFPRFQYDYTVVVEKAETKNGPSVSQTYLITKYFTEDGWFDAEGFEEDVTKQVQKFEAKKFNKTL
uniref:Signal peptidase complex subunit 2 n=1 Tax=Florenciella parvula TaxID=236787 RepID=A0A7S2CXN1_9STRA|mmetsp:Transcript_5828/g.11858  ORF Transcript_5828/g.11858 Transcript_5828/m.11858 type:complete len:220 (+) Transcript_5828:55-714(+)|eukprot:CAMPEP_0182537026 /NCGR_PEP_ID=MMETSP1323-20130603/21203_1 /TAXON_ID=236787 /ORGANISM="Florenciella parvula, Strain RCC1693" /LENGTH=219 /DNA_ID=CAMNT_0024747345 /DNA_START=43 /DNA_END=702 /DNA_ORIENTATION=+